MNSRMIEKQKRTSCQAHGLKIQFYKKEDQKLKILCEQCLKESNNMQVKRIKGMKQELQKGIERYENSIKSGVGERMEETIGKKIDHIKEILNGQFQILQEKDIEISLNDSRSDDSVSKVQKLQNISKRIEEINKIAQINEMINEKRLLKLNQFYYFFKNSQHWLQQAINHLLKIKPQQPKINPFISPLLTQITKLISSNQQQYQRQISSSYKTITELKSQILSYQLQLDSNSITKSKLQRQLNTRTHNYFRVQNQLKKMIKSNPSAINEDVQNQLSILTRKFNDCKALLYQKDTLIVQKNQTIAKITRSYNQLKQQFQQKVKKQQQQQINNKISLQSKTIQNKNYVDELEEEISKINRLNQKKDDIIRKSKEDIEKLEDHNSLQSMEIQRLLKRIKQMQEQKYQRNLQKSLKIKQVISSVFDKNDQQKQQNQTKENSKEMHISYGMQESIISSQPIDISIQQQCPKSFQQISSSSNTFSNFKMAKINQDCPNFDEQPQQLIAVNKTKKYSTSFQKPNSIKQKLNVQNFQIKKKEEQLLVQPKDHIENQFSTSIYIQEQQEQQKIERKKSDGTLINEIDEMVHGKKESINHNKSGDGLNLSENSIQQPARRTSAKIQTPAIKQRQQIQPYKSIVFNNSIIISDQNTQLRLLNCFFEQQLSINSSKMFYSSVSNSKMSVSSIYTLLNSSNMFILTLSNTNITRALYFRQSLGKLTSSSQKSKLPLLLLHTQHSNLFLKLIENKSSDFEIILHFVRQDNPNFSFIFRFYQSSSKILLELKIIEKSRMIVLYSQKKEQLEKIEVLEIFQLRT